MKDYLHVGPVRVWSDPFRSGCLWLRNELPTFFFLFRFSFSRLHVFSWILRSIRETVGVAYEGNRPTHCEKKQQNQNQTERFSRKFCQSYRGLRGRVTWCTSRTSAVILGPGRLIWTREQQWREGWDSVNFQEQEGNSFSISVQTT